MNTKGFTLIELLAVIVILTLLALLTSTTVTKLVNDSKEELSNTQINLIKSAAETWGADNLMDLPSAGECGYLTLEDLKNYGLMDSTVLDPKNSQEISDDLKIKVTTELSTSNELITNYEVDPESVEGCIEIYGPTCTPVTFETATKYSNDSTKTVGNVPNGNFEAGDEYICEVSPGQTYRFYVLPDTYNDDNVRLIMDRDLIDIEWISLEDYKNAGGTYVVTQDNYTNYGNDKGPLTAINSLNKVTEGWDNIPSFDEKYQDEGGNYGTMKLNGKARLPKLEEIELSGCTRVSNENCPLWLINYMNYDVDGVTIGNSYGYWTFSSGDGSSGCESYDAWYLAYDGLYPTWLESYMSESSITYGVRPVITLPKYRFEQ